MKKIILFLAFFMILFGVGISIAEERYKGMLIVDKGGKYELDDKQHVEFLIDNGNVRAIKIRINAANKDLTFSSCRNLEDDGSNFSKWFSLECRELKSFDNTPFTYDYFLIGAYAGISPTITPAYFMYEKLKEVSGKLDMDVPLRTMVIYADGKPLYEFFCYPDNVGIKWKIQ